MANDYGFKYIVIEIQRGTDSVSTLVDSFDSINAAKSKYHLILASAAVSNIYIHSAAILDQNGSMINSEYFVHPQEPEGVTGETGEE